MPDVTITNDPLNIDVEALSNIDPITIDAIRKIAPAAVHIKELNQIDPLSIESLRVDSVRNLEPLQVERLNVTHLPTVNISVSRVPGLDLALNHIPPLAIGIHQTFELPSRYTLRARLLGLEVMRMEIDGCTTVLPRDRYRREVSRRDDRSHPEVPSVGNPAIPSRRILKGARAVVRPGVAGTAPPRPPPQPAPRATPAPRPVPLSFGAPRFNYSLPQGPSDFGGSVRPGG